MRLRPCGLGMERERPEPRDARQISSELHTLLKGADIEGPYVLVGHSYGGLYVRTYADRYPEETAGVVLSTSKIYLRDATITLRSTYGRRRRATATDRTGCL